MSAIGVVPLTKLAEVKLGVKTFLNSFFYVNEKRVKRFKIESRHLEPVFRRADARTDRFLQSALDTDLKIFICSEQIENLVGTGAAQYIKWAEKQHHKGKHGQPGGLWCDTPAVKPAERTWYQNQSMPPPARIALLKAFDDYFAPFIFTKPVRVDQRFNQINPRPNVDEEILVGLLSSTWFVMSLETFGRTAMGQGVLEVPTKDLRALPVPDIRELNTELAQRWKAATAQVVQGARLPIAELARSVRQRGLDTCVLEAFGLEASRLDELYEDTERMTRVRKLLAKSRGSIRRERYQSDLNGVARDIAAQVRPILQNRRFPVDFLPEGIATRLVQLGDAPITVSGELMVGQRHIKVQTNGTVVWEDSLPTMIGELFIRAAQVGQRDFALPQDEADADAALAELAEMVAELDSQLTSLATAASDAARAHLRDKAELELNIPVARLRAPIADSYRAEH